MDPPAKVHTSNFFTPLYTESQETDHTTANTGHQTPQPPNERLDTINEAEEEEPVAATVAEAEAHRTTKLEGEAAALAAEVEALAAAAAAEAEARRKAKLEAEAFVLATEAEALAAAATVEAEATTPTKADAAAAAAAQAAKDIAAAVEAASAAKASVVAAATETEAAKLEAATRKSAAATAVKSLNETEKPKTSHPTNDIPKAQQTGTGPSTRDDTRRLGRGRAHQHRATQHHPLTPRTLVSQPRRKTSSKKLWNGTSQTRTHCQKVQASRATRPS